jgi:hypothetical protein
MHAENGLSSATPRTALFRRAISKKNNLAFRRQRYKGGLIPRVGDKGVKVTFFIL